MLNSSIEAEANPMWSYYHHKHTNSPNGLNLEQPKACIDLVLCVCVLLCGDRSWVSSPVEGRLGSLCSDGPAETQDAPTQTMAFWRFELLCLRLAVSYWYCLRVVAILKLKPNDKLWNFFYCTCIESYSEGFTISTITISNLLPDNKRIRALYICKFSNVCWFAKVIGCNTFLKQTLCICIAHITPL